MASSALTCISSVLGYLRTFLENLHPVQEHELGFIRMWLRSIETFLFCARKWGNDDDASLGALIDRINDYIYKMGLATHTICPASQELGLPKNHLEVLPTDSEDVFDIELWQGINNWYLALSDCSLRHSSNPPFKKDGLVEFIDSLLESLDFCFQFEGFIGEEDLEKLIEALKEKLKFLKNFICFVTLQGVEDGQLGPLFIHTEFVTANAARLYFTLNHYSTSNHITDLLQEIIPTESQVHETCVQALITSKFSRHPYGDADELVLRDFLESLQCNIWSMLKSCTFHMISFKFQLQILWEGFRSLRITLKDKPNKFDEKMRDLTGLVLCEAGLLNFSLSLNATDDWFVREMDLVPLDLLERINLIKLTVAEECLETSPFNFPRTNALAFIDFLLKYMTDLTSSEASLAALADHPVQTIQKDLGFLRSFLGKIVEMRNGDEELQAVWDRVVEVAYTVEFLIDSVLVGDILDSCSLSFDSIVEEIESIKSEASKVFDSKRLDVKEKEVTKRPNQTPAQGSKPTNNDVVVGFEDEATSIINRLTRGSRQVQIVPIVGMPGLGKTTLAKKVYNDSSIISYFYTRAWCTVSQVYAMKNLLLEILTCIESKHSEKFFEMSEEDLAAEVKKGLLRNRYLIVFDDVWDMELWNRLEASFPNDGNGSRVIMTSRLRDVVPQDNLHQEPHYLRQLTHDESWDLLKEKLCPGKDLLPSELSELRMQIVEMCQGLPLTIVILAGILANMDPSGWKGEVQSLSSRNVSSTDQCTTALELSYEHLPDNLKPCFLYFGGFPEDHEHTVKRLIWLWVAEGFVQATDLKSAEDVANDHMMDLINRSLVMVSKQRSIGGVKTCRIHDLLHEFCVKNAKEENFLQLVRGYDELYTLNVPHYLHRLCINSTTKDFNESRLAFPTVRSLLFFAQGTRYLPSSVGLSFNFHLFKLLRVLDLSQINLKDTFPREIELLVHLRYLAILGDVYIPSSIANLENLETFMASSLSWSLPDTIWNLKKLRHLVWTGPSLFGGFGLPTKNLDNSPQLCNLETLSPLRLSSWENWDKIFKKFPNIRKLKCKLTAPHQLAKKQSNNILALDFSSRLESLSLCVPPRLGKPSGPYPVEFHFSLTIRKLTLSGFCLPWSKISAVANLPNLEALKLLREAFVGETWDLDAEEFPELRFLKLASLDIVKWTAIECENSFPRLQKLVLEKCCNLEEIPSSMGNVSPLETIEVSDCPNSANSVKEIQEEQISMGNTGFKVITSSRRRS
ncbi:putative late blight resistance protein homolog R1A-3 [Coffea arabica]|uniref:Late blight resistance protein homolog R1A-3 n=1 Tax=Coffea arabica TaxID=13443 RepID=A0A6P6SB74_COFAR|nr:putative late blight resistance protein homolog R1A-3 [Coffea arabica]